MKKLFIVSILITECLSGHALAQAREKLPAEKRADRLFSNSINLEMGDYYIRNTKHEKGPFVQVGAFYERKLYKYIYVGGGYMEWNTLWKGNFPFDGFDENTKVYLDEENSSFVSGKNYVPTVDQIEYRIRYRMVDLYWYYKYSFGQSSHSINAGLGASYNWGTNTHLQLYNKSPHPPYDAQFYYYHKQGSYWGVVQKTFYSYSFCRNRFSIGVGYTMRYYPQRVKVQHDWNIRTGINF